MSNSKRFFLIIAIILALAALALFAYSRFELSRSSIKEEAPSSPEIGSSTPLEGIPAAPISEVEPIIITEPEYLTEEEARSMRLSPREKIQVLERDEEGKVTAYKIIRNENDVVLEFLPAEPEATITSASEE